MHCKNIVLKTSKTLFETAIIDSESALINVLAVVNSLQNVQKVHLLHLLTFM